MKVSITPPAALIGIDAPIFTLRQHRLNIALKRHRQHSSVAPVFLERLRIRQPFGPRSQPVQFLTQGLLRLMGGRQLRCRFIRLLRRFISLLHSLRTLPLPLRALFQRLSLFGLRLVFPAAAQLLQFAYRLGGFGLCCASVFRLFLLPLCLLSAAASAVAEVRLSPWRLRPCFQRRLQAFLLLLPVGVGHPALSAAAPVAAEVRLSPWRLRPSAVPAPSSGFSLVARPVGVDHHALSAAAPAAAGSPVSWQPRPSAVPAQRRPLLSCS